MTNETAVTAEAIQQSPDAEIPQAQGHVPTQLEQELLSQVTGSSLTSPTSSSPITASLTTRCRLRGLKGDKTLESMVEDAEGELSQIMAIPEVKAIGDTSGDNDYEAHAVASVINTLKGELEALRIEKRDWLFEASVAARKLEAEANEATGTLSQVVQAQKTVIDNLEAKLADALSPKKEEPTESNELVLPIPLAGHQEALMKVALAVKEECAVAAEATGHWVRDRVNLAEVVARVK